MQSSNAPNKIQLPFAASGTKNTIPVPSQQGVTPGAASFTDGFPPLTFTPLSAGGVPPAGADFNGILNSITALQQWKSAGGQFPFDATFAAAIGGYPKGAMLLNSTFSGLWVCTADNNTANPDTGGAGWVAFMPHGKQIFTSSGSITVPSGVSNMWLSGCAGGAGGGGGAYNNAVGLFGSGGGGGAGAFLLPTAVAVTPGTVLTVTVGAGGSGGSASTGTGQGGNGANGGTTSVVGTGVNISLSGGIGGTGCIPYTTWGQSPNGPGSGGAGGSPSSIGSAGGAGGSGMGPNAANAVVPAPCLGGIGGSTAFGQGANCVFWGFGANGSAGSGYGSGGSGGQPNTSAQSGGGAGGNGAAGILILEW